MYLYLLIFNLIFVIIILLNWIMKHRIKNETIEYPIIGRQPKETTFFYNEVYDENKYYPRDKKLGTRKGRL